MKYLLSTISIIIAFFLGHTLSKHVYEREITITKIIRDTIVIRSPEVTEIRPLRKQQAALPKTDNPTETVFVEIPIEQHIYQDSTYTAYISGYQPRLDSLILMPVTAQIKTPHQKRWSIGIQGGIGMTPAGIQPYIGVGIAYRFF